jgi:hypothetical protein
MFTKKTQGLRLGFLAVAVMLLGAIPVFAHDGPHHTAVPQGESYRQIAPGEMQWLSFRSEGEGDNILVTLDAALDDNGIGGLTFKIFTPQNLREWMDGLEVNPVGRGSEQEVLDADLVWQGNFVNPGTYYIIVENQGSTPNSYLLQATGDDIWFDLAAPSEMMPTSPAPMMMPQPGEVALAVVDLSVITGGLGPEASLSPQGQWIRLAPGASLWFSFTSRGENDDILAQLTAEPAQDFSFEVLTPDDLRERADGLEVTPVGRGSENETLSSDLSWRGNFNIAGQYHIVVENNGSAPGFFSLEVAGDDISL